MRRLFVTLVALFLGAVVCFFAGLWSYAPSAVAASSTAKVATYEESVPVFVSVSDLVAECKRLWELPWHAEASERRYEAIRLPIEHGDAEGIFMEIAGNSKIEAAERQIGNIAIAELARRDPAKAWELAMQTLDAEARIDFAYAVCRFWSERDPETVLKKIEPLPASEAKKFIVICAMREIVKTDPRRVVALAVDSKGSSDLVSDAFFILAKKDPAQARAAAEKLDSTLRLRAMKAIVEVLSHSDPAAAWKMASVSGIPVEVGQGSLHSGILRSWAKKDPQAALDMLGSIAESNTQAQLLGETVLTWSRKNFDAAFDYVIQMDEPNCLANGLKYLCDSPKANHERLFEALVERIPPGEALQSSLAWLADGWVRKDPRAAARAAAELPQSQAQSLFADRVLDEWSRQPRSNKKEILDWITALPEGQARKGCLDRFFSNSFDGNPQASFDMIPTLPPEKQPRARQRIFELWVGIDPHASLEWAQRLPESEERTAMFRQVVGEMCDRGEITEALTVLHSQPTFMQDKDTVRGFVESWAAHDAAAAERWTRILSAGAVKDEALVCVCSHLAASDPKAALAAAATMNDPSERTASILKIAGVWKYYDPSAATAWIAQNNITDPLDLSDAAIE